MDLLVNGALGLFPLQGILRYARRHGWIRADPVELLETWERPRPRRRRQRVLGRDEIEPLLAARPPRGRLLVTTARCRSFTSTAGGYRWPAPRSASRT